MPTERVANIKESYVVKAATTLGVIHIVCGIAVLIASITGLVFNVYSIGENFDCFCHSFLVVRLHSTPFSKDDFNREE